MSGPTSIATPILSKFRSKHGARADRFRHGRGRLKADPNRSKHQRRWALVVGGRTIPMRTRPSRAGERYVVESRATARRPWTVRTENRAANRRARASRKANR